jgi:dTDP-4-amino-4,6-dideoxygalactose transaminase
MSHPERVRSKGRTLASAVAALLILLSLAYTPSLKAAPRRNCLWYQSVTYYTDASMTTMCGGTTWFCDGETGHGGCWTQYYRWNYCDCIEEP